jgi:hypothetical protein
LPRAEAVIRAFLTNSTIPRGIIITEETTEIEKYSETITPKLGVEDLKGNFEEFL